MPVMDGLAAASNIRERDGHASLPWIVSELRPRTTSISVRHTQTERCMPLKFYPAMHNWPLNRICL